MDSETTVEELKQSFCRFRDEMDWDEVHTVENVSSAISVEAAELLELFLWSKSSNGLSEADQVNVSHELADIIMLCLSMADLLDVDICDLLTEKMAIHRRKYTEI